MSTLFKGLLLGTAMAALAGGASAAGLDFDIGQGVFAYDSSASTDWTSPVDLLQGKIVSSPKWDAAGLKNLIDGAGRKLTIIEPLDGYQTAGITFDAPATDYPAIQWTSEDMSWQPAKASAGMGGALYYNAGLKSLIDKAGRPGVIRPLDPQVLPKGIVPTLDIRSLENAPVVPIKANPGSFEGLGILDTVYFTGG